MNHRCESRQGRDCPHCRVHTVGVYMALLSPFPRLQRLLQRIAFPSH